MRGEKSRDTLVDIRTHLRYPLWSRRQLRITGEHFCEGGPLAAVEKILERVLVQRLDESVQRFAKHTLELADIDDRAGVGFGVEAFDDPQVRLDVTHDVAEPDRMRLTRQRYATQTSGNQLDVTM